MLEIAHADPGAAAVVVRKGVFRIELDRLVEVLDGVVEIALHVAGIAAVVVGNDEVLSAPLPGFDRRRAAENHLIGREGISSIPAPVDLLLGLRHGLRQRQRGRRDYCRAREDAAKRPSVDAFHRLAKFTDMRNELPPSIQKLYARFHPVVALFKMIAEISNAITWSTGFWLPWVNEINSSTLAGSSCEPD